MYQFLKQSADRRRVFFDEAQAKLGLRAASIEKDFWVCLILRELFSLPECGAQLTFKGGTSLSKAWKLIERFSEDIDVVLNRKYLGFGDEQSPESAPSKKQRDKRLEDLKVACQQRIRDSLEPALATRLKSVLPQDSSWNLTRDESDPDGQTLLFHYTSVYAKADYIRPVVKIEMGARSDIEPHTTPQIQPYLAEAFPAIVADSWFAVRTVAPERTFWEKAMLLHEETFRAPGGALKVRLARHYYDLWCLIRKGVAEKAIADTALFNRVVAHRSVFFRRSKEAQDSLKVGSLCLVPLAGQLPAWRQDFQSMREEMFFGDVPSFDEILRVVSDFEKRFNQGK
jgi:hypothetical protein